MNIATNAMERLTKMSLKTHEKLKAMGAIPYGMEKLTPAQQKQMFDNLTPQKLEQLILQHGEAEVNKWLAKYM
ncbi:unnamed protein product [marine sediment metagenome]|uniref:Uncharacterized protein n=1 Tax=marine sediment metagenome TaxID=412755 RepID=X1PPW7_9ZZZZ